MRIRLAVPFLTLLLAAGCGGEGTTDPDSLPPLTDEQKAEIQAHDQEIQDEESGELDIQPKDR